MRNNPVGLRPRALAAVACAGSFAVLVAACTSSGSQSPSGSQGVIPSFAFAIGAAPISLDISKDFDDSVVQYVALVTEKLEAISSTGQFSPDLATSVSTPNPTTLVYHIRNGVKFSDGTPLTATDVAWSLNHMTDTKAGAQTAGVVASFKSATASGPLSVTVKLSRSDPTARAGIAVISEIQESKFGKAHANDLGSPGALPIGTGPYMFSSDTPQAVMLVRNPNYWGTPPAAEKLVFNVITGGDNAAQLAMRSKAVQGSFVSNLKTASQWHAISGSHLYTLPGLKTTFLSLDVTGSGPLSDVNVRKAIAHSLDRAGVLQAAYGSSYATLMQGMAVSGLLGDVVPSQQAASAFFAGLPQYNFSIGTAKSDLARSKFPHGFSLTMPYLNGDPASQLVAENLQQNMKQLGVKINLKLVTEQEWLAYIYAHKNLGLQTMHLNPPAPDPAGLLGFVTGRAQIRPQGFDVANWAPPQLEKSITTLTTSTDKAARWSATKTILTAIANDVPYIPLFSPDTVVVLGNGFSFSKPLNLFDLEFNGTWIDGLTKS